MMIEKELLKKYSYEEILKNKDYEFLTKNEHLGKNIIMLCFGGSHAYGTNIETSDVDIRGIAIERPEEIIGFKTFEQFINESTDTTIYAFNKIVKLLIDNNPNIIECLGLKPEHYIYLSPLGKELLEHKDLFLSQKCFYTFGGYARANLKRLQNALARDNYIEEEKNRHIAISLENAISAFNAQHNNEVNPAFAHVKDGKLVYDLDLKDFPADDLENLYSTISNTTRNYKELLNRNRKKDDAHLNKHAMHLVRLYLMCLDILKKGKIITYRKKDHELLMDIRNGKYMDKDGTMNQEFYDLVASIEEKCKRALETTKLPKKPDIKKIEEWVMSVNKRIINGDF
ncbi:MAG: nucleotidyltransferase domain-containing protein [Bacilli bacterium]|nr:nucleotidyltransferase domain-containing protein [Bacilli bacterium]